MQAAYLLRSLLFLHLFSVNLIKIRSRNFELSLFVQRISLRYQLHQNQNCFTKSMQQFSVQTLPCVICTGSFEKQHTVKVAFFQKGRHTWPDLTSIILSCTEGQILRWKFSASVTQTTDLNLKFETCGSNLNGKLRKKLRGAIAHPFYKCYSRNPCH